MPVNSPDKWSHPSGLTFAPVIMQFKGAITRAQSGGLDHPDRLFQGTIPNKQLPSINTAVREVIHADNGREIDI